MSKGTRSLIIIVLAVAVAAAGGYLISRQSAEPQNDPPHQVYAAIPAGGGHFRGPESAQVTLVEFGDYQCPSCGAYYPMVEEVLRRFPTQVRLEFHHYPIISAHPNAMPAAMAAEAAGDQNHYWEMHDLLYQHQKDWSDMANAQPIFVSYATQIGLDPNKFMQSLRAPETQQRVLQDVMRANAIEVNQTPTFFIGRDRATLPMTVDELADWVKSHFSAK